MGKNYLNQKDAAAFVAEGIRQPEEAEGMSRHACCVDGRCAEGQTHGLAAPGGDMELVLAAAAVARARRAQGLPAPSVEALWRATLSFLGGRLCVHSDTHVADGAPRWTGCGHVRHALHDAAAYGMAAEDAAALAALLTRALAEAQTESAVRCDTYAGDHREGAVVVNESERRMAAHTNAHGQAFVFDAARSARRLRAYAAAIAPLFGVTGEDAAALGALTEELFAAAARGREETLRRLAAGLPVYRLTEKEGEVRTEAAGVVPAAPQEAAD